MAHRPTASPRRLPIGGRLLGALLLAAAAGQGCGGEQATPQAVTAARKVWDRAAIRDYNLEWTSRGPRNVHYRVFVRAGAVRAIYSVLNDGREVEMKPAEPRFYGVDGLFTTILDELAQLEQPRPFNQPKGTRVVLRFEPDPRLGYPLRYRRDVFGTPQSLVLSVLRLEPDPPSEIPPPISSPGA